MVAFNIESVHSHSYFESLIELSHDRQNIRMELFVLLKTQMNKFTGEDSSVSKERAQSLMNSLLYVTSLYLKQYSKEVAFELIQNKHIHELYNEGLLWIKYLMNTLIKKVSQIQSSMVLTDYQIYNETLKAGFNAFLKHYNYEYNAPDHIITFDYPLLRPIHNCEGIELFYNYTTAIIIENTFCNYFNKIEIQRMLECYQENYQLYIFNISEMVLKQMLLNALVNDNIEFLVLNKSLIKNLYIILNNKSKVEIYNVLVNVYDDCMNRLDINEHKIIHYFYQQLKSLSLEIYYGCLYQTLEKELSYLKNHHENDDFNSISYY